MTEEPIINILRQVKYPGFSRDIVSFGIVKEARSDHGKVFVRIELSSSNRDVAETIDKAATQVLESEFGKGTVHVEVHMPTPAATANESKPQTTSGIRKIIAVASGKGGVGKSTTSVNLACAFQKMGLEVGLLDCDIYGPSVPLMMGVNGRPEINSSEHIIPMQAHGVRVMSMGFINEGDNPVIWRGPMIVKTIQQFLFSVAWGALDVLLVDLPPGTGDAQLTLCQTVPLAGGIIVTTPQEASLGVVRKGMNMFRKVNVPLLGVIENMSWFEDPQGNKHFIFGDGGGQTEAQKQNIPFLGAIPILQNIREGGDKGTPVTAASHTEGPGRYFFEAATRIYQSTLNH